MPALEEQMYCSQQIVIPPKYPYILKKYCKAAIKTQPYDLLRWSFEYFRALAEHRPPPVKLRLEYPIYSTEGGLTRGCLKVLANQLTGLVDVPIPVVKRAWQGFCLDPTELRRILCLCEVYNRAESVPFLHFIAVAGGMLTKCLTHTMILLCESLTKEPDGGSAAIPLKDFLRMYRFLAAVDASADVKYYGGYREGHLPQIDEEGEEEQSSSSDLDAHRVHLLSSEEDFWQDTNQFTRVDLINDKVDTTARVSTRVKNPLIGYIERSPSVERANQRERQDYLSDRKGKPMPDEEVEKQLRKLSALTIEHIEGVERKEQVVEETAKQKETEKEKEIVTQVLIYVFDEDDNNVEYEFYGEPPPEPELDEELEESMSMTQDQGVSVMQPPDTSKSQAMTLDMAKSKLMAGIAVDRTEEQEEETEAIRVMNFVAEVARAKEEKVMVLEEVFDDIAALVDKFKSANYDLGMVAGRQMSTTSGEFIVQSIEKDILAYIDEQIAILPDPDLKKKKAKPEEVEMVRGILETFIEENMDIIVPEIEEVEEEEQPIPEITMVYAVPGIGPIVDPEIVIDFEDYAKEVTKVQAEVIMPRNLRHFLCPPLEKYIEYKYADAPGSKQKKEEVAFGGTITD